jgi:hypothetical protein
MIFSSPDNQLAIPGGYVLNRFIVSPRFEIMLYSNSWSVGYGQRANEGGSGRATGFIFVEFKE